jgi:Sec-independent protein secretion pathway component TatC
VLSQFLLAVPMWILYEIGVFVAKRLHRRPEAAQATGEQLPVASKRE